MLESTVEETLTYTKNRDAFDKPPFDMQNNSFDLADCATIKRAARVFVDD